MFLLNSTQMAPFHGHTDFNMRLCTVDDHPKVHPCVQNVKPTPNFFLYILMVTSPIFEKSQLRAHGHFHGDLQYVAACVHVCTM